MENSNILFLKYLKNKVRNEADKDYFLSNYEYEIIKEYGLDTQELKDIIDLCDILSERLLLYAAQIHDKIKELEKESENGR